MRFRGGFWRLSGFRLGFRLGLGLGFLGLTDNLGDSVFDFGPEVWVGGFEQDSADGIGLLEEGFGHGVEGFLTNLRIRLGSGPCERGGGVAADPLGEDDFKTCGAGISGRKTRGPGDGFGGFLGYPSLKHLLGGRIDSGGGETRGG